ncbi:DUF1858 domain-containing protein [Patescibacteria group bacterium]|nr:DUF1858 domain-containing protein [Patescibacteria group bacterium]MBU4481198.1 DUF1858 domain-containing protein [Patescibacteria group bacterium]
MAKMSEITKDTTLAEILKRSGAEEILLKYNLPCLGCPLAKFDHSPFPMGWVAQPFNKGCGEVANLKIGEVCKMYGVDLEGLLKKLNKKLKGNS